MRGRRLDGFALSLGRRSASTPPTQLIRLALLKVHPEASNWCPTEVGRLGGFHLGGALQPPALTLTTRLALTSLHKSFTYSRRSTTYIINRSSCLNLRFALFETIKR